MQKIHNFCSETLGGYYLDVIKDRQYTTPADSRARRSCQTAQYLIGDAMTRWIAPILSFTADEIWEHLPGEREPMGVFTAEWSDRLFAYDHATIPLEVWKTVEPVRTEALRQLEILRQQGDIGAGLDADVKVHADSAILDRLAALGDELRFVMITSSVSLSPLAATQADAAVKLSDGSRFAVAVSPSPHAKCVRCWHHRDDVGSHAQHPELCGRCVENIDGSGESRRFA